MPTTYNSNGTIPAVTKFAPVAIVSSTATTPIVMHVTAHGFADGDTVQQGGHDQLAANGLWQITKVDADHYSLNGSTAGAGAGTATGIAWDYSVNPLITIPADGDLASASSVNPALEGTFNLAPFFMQRVGKYRLFDEYVLQTSDDTWAAWSTNASLGTAAWGTVASGTGLIGLQAAKDDILDITFTCTGTTGGVPAVPVGLGASFQGGAYGIITGSAQEFSIATANQPMCLRGIYTVPASSNPAIDDSGSAINLGIMAYGNGGSPPSLNLIGHRTMIVRHLRSNA